MAKLSILAGSTSQSVNVFIQNSSVTTGAGLTGLVFNTAGLTANYSFNGAASGAFAITLVSQTPGGAYSSGGFTPISAGGLPGLYRLDLPNAVLAAGNGRSVTVYLFGATNMAPCVFEIELTAIDNQNATNFGMSGVTFASSQIFIKKNQPLSNFEFVMISSADNISPATGLTVTANRSIDGAAFAACANAPTELSNGVYIINLAATDLNGTVITLRFTATGALARIVTLITQP